MNIINKNEMGKLVFYLIGELDHHTAEEAERVIDSSIENCSSLAVIFDFSKLSFMDSTGIGVLLGRYKKLKERNMILYARGANGVIEKLLKLSGIYNIFIKI